ncbi:MAG: efflux RND transporter periplasmic adaptor subunit [Deltaproteobacteria bacterium]|nr:efflux RND transporter periplasmic adaptor subunit [Deltaproteobacteria bacterium]
MRIGKKKIFASLFAIIFVFLLTITLSRFVYGHGEEEQLGGENENKGSSSISNSAGVELSDIAQKSIGLKVVEADIRSIEDVLLINGIVKPEPNRVAEVNTRAEGHIQELYVNLGDQVNKGQKLAVMVPRQIGNPPPLVSITAPLSGTVVERNVSLHSTVEPNKTLFRIADLSKVIVEGDAFESDISKVELGQDVRIRLDAYPDKVFTGKVTFVASELDPMKRALHFWVSVDNKDGLLKPELFANVALIVEHSREVLTVPIEAIIDDGAEKFVFVKNGNQFVRQDIATGVSNDRYVEITDGLYPGDQVVTDGNRQIYTKWLFSR